MKNEIQIWISMFIYFENRKNHLVWCFMSQFSIETNIKTLILISYFIYQKNEMAL